MDGAICVYMSNCTYDGNTWFLPGTKLVLGVLLCSSTLSGNQAMVAVLCHQNGFPNTLHYHL